MGLNVRSVSYHGPTVHEYRTLDIFLFLPGVWGTEMRYMAVAIDLTLSRRVIGYKKGLDASDAWNTFLQTEVSIFSLKWLVEGLGLLHCRSIYHILFLVITPVFCEPQHVSRNIN